MTVACGAMLALAAPARSSDCEDGTRKVGWLGVDLDECNCTYSYDTSRGTVWWQFREEPSLGGVRDDGPSAGKLREGDIVESVDGSLITTAEGGRRFAALQPGVPVTLVVRRDGRDVKVQVTPGSICLGELFKRNAPLALPGLTPFPAPAPMPVPEVAPVPRTPRTPGMPRMAPAPPMPPMTPMPPETPRAMRLPIVIRDRGWLGVGLNFENCEERSDSAPNTWCFGTQPEIYYVDPGSPAATAGLQRGDVITLIDGVSIVTPEGGRRFTEIKPGQRVRFTVSRGNSTRTAEVLAVRRGEGNVAELRPLLDLVRGMREGQLANKEMVIELDRLEQELKRLSLPEPTAPERDRRLRYAGSVGSADVEVRGVGNVVVDDSGEGLIIVTRDATIHVKPGAKGTPKATPAPRPAATPRPKK